MWASSGLSGLFLVDIQLACGPDLGNRSVPPKCHHSMWCVGRMKVPKVSGVGWIWATATLPSGNVGKTKILNSGRSTFISGCLRLYFRTVPGGW